MGSLGERKEKNKRRKKRNKIEANTQKRITGRKKETREYEGKEKRRKKRRVNNEEAKNR